MNVPRVSNLIVLTQRYAKLDSMQNRELQRSKKVVVAL
jgi:hypothetical protein